jgi:3-oxoacyl-[acyl-carrier-protein] synthase III
MYLGIIGTDACLPERVLTNAEPAVMVDTTDEWNSQWYEQYSSRARNVPTLGFPNEYDTAPPTWRQSTERPPG